MRIKLVLFLFIVTFQLGYSSTEHPASTSEKPLTEKEKIAKENQEYIQHHIKDSHYFDVFVDKKNNVHYGIPLPVIIFDKDDKEFIVFMSSEFEHGEQLVNKNGKYYKLYHEQIYKTDASGDLKLDEHAHPTASQPIDLSMTKAVVIMLLVSFIMFIILVPLAKSYKKHPIPTNMIGRIMEPMIVFVRDEIAKPNIGDLKYKKYVGYLLTAFFFILFVNILGLTPFGVNVTGNITVTFFFAIVTYLITQFSANKDYWKHIFWMPGVPWPMKIIMFPIELLGTLTKPFALMIRLFANMSAGHIVIMSLIGLIYVFKSWMAGISFTVLSFVIYLLEVLVAFLQAYIFTMLSALFIGMAVQEHEHHDHKHEHEHEPKAIETH